MKKTSILILVGVLLFSLNGCGKPEQVVSSDPLCLPGVNVPDAMEAAQDVLDQMQFSIEKYDPQARYIRTRPLSGAQFFQVWRQDNASAYTAAEANVHSLRRIVEIEAVPYANRTCLDCRVYVQQLSIPEKQIKGVISMAGAYTDSSTSTQTLSLDDEQLQKMEWLDKGLDRALEKKILDKIKKEATQ